MDDVTVFFTKPHIDKPTALEVIAIAENCLEKSKGVQEIISDVY